MKFIFEALNTIRKNTLEAVAHLSEEQLNTIPNGLNNNIIWNLGHIVASQQILCYKLGNAPLVLPTEFIDKYRKGTDPKGWTQKADLQEIKGYFALTSSRFEEDYKKAAFANFSEYQTSSGIVLRNIDEALVYNYGHENLHYGVVLTQRRLV